MLPEFLVLLRILATVPNTVDAAIKKGIKKGTIKAMGRAKEKLGKYQGTSGSFTAWSKLKPETVRRKHLSKSGSGRITRAGKAYIKKHGSWGAGGNDDAPLIDTGHLRQAITTDFSELESRGIAYLGVAAGSDERGKGSPSDYAAAHEFGDAAHHIPPRPFLRPAVEESRSDILNEVKKALEEAARGYRR
ncbi:hypothetical protein [Bacillus sp. 3255]|uniref:hypothetical protein n=1 Tax=Bacillus sp. 3255 TaxID=2817904 RepID=UPI002864814E|nr:hypothetical protein [Bacillus sp. 3255]MDR6883025.1 phage gpG-like protein [Bacillus sp. 3255]